MHSKLVSVLCLSSYYAFGTVAGICRVMIDCFEYYKFFDEIIKIYFMKKAMFQKGIFIVTKMKRLKSELGTSLVYSENTNPNNIII